MPTLNRTLARRVTQSTLLTVAVLAAAQTAFADVTYTLQQVSPTGGVYTGTSANGNLESSNISAINSSGAAVGTAVEYPSAPYGFVSGYGTGAVWYYSAATGTKSIDLGSAGVTNPAYSYTAAGTLNDGTPAVSLYAMVASKSLSSTGFATGSSGYFVSGSLTGVDAWLFNPSTGVSSALPLPANTAVASFSTTTSTDAPKHSMSSYGVSGAGNVVGTATTYDSTGNSIGSEAYRYNRTTNTSTVVSPEDTVYQYYTGAISAGIGSMNASGTVLGYVTKYQADQFTSNGYDYWLSLPTATSPVILAPAAVSGVTFSVSQTYSSTFALNASNQVVGTESMSGTMSGKQAFFYADGASHNIGLTGSDYSYTNNGVTTYSSSAGDGRTGLLSNTGVVAGNNARYTSTGAANGFDAWAYKYNAASPGSSQTVQIGLTGAAYTSSAGSRTSYPSAISANGQIAGYSYVGGVSGSQDTWYVDTTKVNFSDSTSGLTNTKLIGLNPSTGYTGTTFQTSSGSRYSYVTAINSIGDVAGSSFRYDSTGNYVGADAWVFVPTANGGAGHTYDILGSLAADGVTASSSIVALSDTGVAVGEFEKYDGDTDLGSFAFMWSEATGFEDLNLEISPSLSAAGWTSLANSVGITSSGLIFVTGLPGTDASGSSAVAILSPTAAVPEPATLGLLSIASLAMLRRRR